MDKETIDPALEPFGTKLRRLIGTDRTQAWLADESDLDRALVCRIIKGKTPLPQHIHSMATTLEMTALELVSETDAVGQIDPKTEEQRQALMERIKQLESACADLRSQVHDLKTTASQTDAELETTKELLEAAQTETDTERKRSQKLKDKSISLRRDLEELKEDLEREEDARAYAEDRAQRLNTEVKRLKIDNNGLRALAKKLKNHIEALSEENNELRKSRMWTGVWSSLAGAAAGALANENKDKF